jgi:hypothetical protein
LQFEFAPTSMFRRSPLRSALGAAGATTWLLLAGSAGAADATVVTPHVVAPQAVSPHLVEAAPSPPPAPSAAPAESSAPAPAPSEGISSSGEPEVLAPVAESPRPEVSTGRGPSADARPHGDPLAGDDPHWAWLTPGDPGSIGDVWVMVPWREGDELPLFGFGWDLPLPGDGPKPSEIAATLDTESTLLRDEVNRDLLGPHKAVTDPGHRDPAPDDGGPPDDGSDVGGGGEEGGEGGGGGARDLDDPGYEEE